MRQANKRIPESAEKTVRDIRRATRRHHSAEEKIRIVLEGLRGEESIAELCRKEGINQNLYYRWSKEFLEAGKKRLAGDTAREATSDEVKELKAEARQLMSQKETLLSSAAAACATRAAARTQRRISILPIRKEEAATQRSGGGQDRLKRSLMNSGSHPEAVLGPGAIARYSTTTRRSTSPFR